MQLKSDEIMQKKTIYVGSLLLITCGVILMLSFAAQAADIKKDDTNKILYIASGSYNLSSMLDHANVTTAHLWRQSPTGKVWQANYTIQINASATLRLNPTDNCTWLKLNNSNTGSKQNGCLLVIGRLFVNNTMVTGWNATSLKNATTYSSFRPYIYIKPVTDADPTYAQFLNSRIGYLGYNADNKYGVVYEDIANKDPDGYMRNCTVRENYIGICFQGVCDMNVTDSAFNNTISAGIVYTTGGVTAQGSDDGYVGVQSLAGTTVRDTVDGLRVTSSDNFSCDNLNVYDCTDNGFEGNLADNITITNSDFYANGDDGISFVHVTNSTITSGTVCNNSVDCGIFFDNSSLNEISAIHNHDNEYDFYIDVNSNNNTLHACSGDDSTDSFEIIGSYNDLDNCTATDATDSGFKMITGDWNDFDHCSASACSVGFDMYGAAQNNTIRYCTFSSNDWGIWMWPSAGTNCRSNIFSNCTINSNSQTGIDIGRAPLNVFYDCDIFNNTVYGVEVNTNSTVVFINCTADNPYPNECDWYIDDTSIVGIGTSYILGFNKWCNHQYDAPRPYGAVIHVAGDGIWELNTTQMTVYCQADNESYVNLTYWDTEDQKIQWRVNASTGTILYQKIGNLTAGERYDLKVNGVIQSTNYSIAGTMMPSQGATAYVWFNYSGSWSNKTFTVEKHAAVEGGEAASETGDVDSDGDGLTDDFEEQIGTNPNLADTDGDGYNDYVEVLAGSNPNDANSTPTNVGTFIGISILWWIIIIFVVILLIALVIIYFYLKK